MTARAAMLFAAGFGTRAGKLTQDRPKPLLRAGGKPLIDHALSVIEQAGVERCVVNVHYRAEMISGHLAGRRGIILSPEFPDILETGGGLLAALPLLGPEPVYTLNSDTVWRGPNPLAALERAWPIPGGGAVLLLSPPSLALAHSGKGDFVLDGSGRIRRCSAGEDGLVYAGAQIIRTDGLQRHGRRVFSLNLEWDRLAERGELFGIVHEGEWIDAGTPEGLRLAQEIDEGASH